MTTQANIGYGALFQTGNGATPEVFTTWGEMTKVKPPNRSRDTVDASHTQSPEAWREFIAGMKDGGECQVDFNLVPGGVTAAAINAEWDLVGAAALKNRRVVFPDGTYCAFAAILTGDEPDTPLDDKMAQSITLKVSGKPIFGLS